MDFSTDNGPVENGESPNPLDMNGNDVTLVNTSVEVFTNISLDVGIKEAVVSATLMNAVKDNGDGLSITLIENIAGDKTSVSDLAGAMNLQSDAPSTSVTYLDQNGNTIADITTCVGISSSYSEDTKGPIGLIYGAVNEVVVYDQKSGNGYGCGVVLHSIGRNTDSAVQCVKKAFKETGAKTKGTVTQTKVQPELEKRAKIHSEVASVNRQYPSGPYQQGSVGSEQKTRGDLS